MDLPSENVETTDGMQHDMERETDDSPLAAEPTRFVLKAKRRGEKRIKTPVAKKGQSEVAFSQNESMCNEDQKAISLNSLTLIEDDPAITKLLEMAESLENIPDGENNWKRYLQSLANLTGELARMLQTEILQRKQKDSQIHKLKEQISKLNTELETSKQWQYTIYSQMQKITVYMQQQFQNQKNYFDLTSTFENNKQHSVNQEVIKNEGKKKKNKKKKTSKASKAIMYGDAVQSKKLADRKRFGETKREVTEVASDDQTETEVNMDALDYPIQTTDEQTPVDNKEELQEKTEMSVEETLRQAAESTLSTSGFVYDEQSGLYYDWNSKMYYDPSTKLYYDHDNGIYYTYDTERNSYLFHSQVNVPQNSMDIEETVRTKSELSDGELCSDESDVDSTEIDPCVRAIVVKSECLDVGTLFVVTCKGGTIGRERTNLIHIPEEPVSKSHAYIFYDERDRTFYIQDRKTVNGTFINNERLADPRTSSEPVEIAHRDFIKVGETTLSFHIHIGNTTCPECEPGHIQAIVAENAKSTEIKDDLNALRKKEMKSMRKKYGISPGYIPKGLIGSIPDRAGRRRKEVGSEAYDNVDKPVTKASVNKEIPKENIGHKMLAKMGWKSGEGLGKTGDGITQPVTVDILSKNKGLGASEKISMDQAGSGDRKKQEKWEKARERYNKLN